MKIGLRGGHSPNCKGAMGYLDEQAEVRKIYKELAPMLQSAGHTVVDCNSDASTVNGELSEGTNKANAAGCDIYMTLHMNASGGAGNGTECFLYNAGNAAMNGFASAICKNFVAAGFQNRGVKYNTGYHDLNASAMPATIVETLFCDNKHDAELYNKLGSQGIAELIAKAFGYKNGANVPVTPAKKPDGHNVHLYENNGNGNQKWLLEKEGEYLRLKCKATGEYLDTAGKAKSGTNLKTYKKSASAGQFFKLVPIEDKASDTECYKIVCKADQKLVVDVAGAGTKNKTNIQLYADNGTKAQQWYFRKDADGYMIFNVLSLKALDGGGAL